MLGSSFLSFPVVDQSFNWEMDIKIDANKIISTKTQSIYGEKEAREKAKKGLIMIKQSQ